MTSSNKDSHLYLKFEKTDRTLDIDSLHLKFSSDLILDLSFLENVDKAHFSSLNQINRDIINAGFCLVIVLKESLPIINRESLNIVPTLIEAEDYLKMEQIQRDLGTSL